jgi:hypothetical protein
VLGHGELGSDAVGSASSSLVLSLGGLFRNNKRHDTK